MALSDSQWLAWLNSEFKNPVVLVEAKYYDSTLKTLYFSDCGYIDPFDVNAPNYIAIIESKIVINNSLQSSILSNLDIYNFDNALLNYQFIGQDFKVFYGDKSWPRADFRQEAFNKVANFSSSNPRSFTFEFEDIGKKYFNQLIIGNGTGAQAGLPFVFGKCFNVQPIREDATHYSYFTPAVISFPSEVRDRGVPLVLGGGADYTLSVTVDGSGDGLKITIVFAVIPSGEITCDIELNEFPIGTPLPNESTIDKILTQTNSYVAAPITIASSVSGFNDTYLGYVCYNYITTGQMLNEMCDSIGANPRINSDGELELIRVTTGGTATRTVDDSDIFGFISLEQKEPPYLALSVGYQKNWKLQTTNLVDSLTDAEYALYARDFTYVSDSASLPAYPFEVAQKRDTLIYDLTDATNELDRRFALRSSERSVWKLRGNLSFVYDKIGTTISIKTEDYGMSAGNDFVVISNSLNLSDNYCEVKVWK